MRLLVWHLYVDTAVEGTELYCYNTKGDRNSIVSQVSCSMNVTRLEQRAYIKIAVLRGSFYKLTVAFSSIA